MGGFLSNRCFGYVSRPLVFAPKRAMDHVDNRTSGHVICGVFAAFGARLAPLPIKLSVRTTLCKEARIVAVIPSEIEREVAEARRKFRRVLCAWASDALELRRTGLDRPTFATSIRQKPGLTDESKSRLWVERKN